MASYINMFLKSELTFIPRLLDKYVGNYYNNTLCNGATWMLFTWFILHLIFDDLLNALFKKMKCKEYIRSRLRRALWYSGFYTTACIYSLATLVRNDLKIVNFRDPLDGAKSPSGHLILGFIVLLTFHLHSAVWEKLKNNDGKLCLNYLTLSVLLCFSYFLRFVEGVFRLTVFISSAQVALELCRCAAVQNWEHRRLILGSFLVLTSAVYTLNYLFLVPILFGFPLARKLTVDVGILFLCLKGWLLLELSNSVLVKIISHWVYHQEAEKCTCEKDVFECSLFSPRCDSTYSFLILRKEMEEREHQSMALRKPKTRNVMFQTLKCMVAIKRKLHDKRQENKQKLEENKPPENKESVSSDDCDESEEVVGGKLEFNINNKNDSKFKQE